MVTSVQRRLIEYWKLKFEQSLHTDDVAFDELIKAFQSAKAVEEELAYWIQNIDNVDLGNLRRVVRLTQAFEAKGDMVGASQFWKNRFSCDKAQYWDWDFLGELRSRGVFDEYNVINICKAKLQQYPFNEKAANALVKQSKSLDPEARIMLLKSALHLIKLDHSNALDLDEEFLPEDVTEVLVDELTHAMMEKGDEEYAIGFWKEAVRKFPSSWPVSNAMHVAFVNHGDYQAAMEFWGRMRRVGPKEQHFAHFSAKSCNDGGNVEEAMKIWWLWLDYFLSDIESPARDEFSVRVIVNSLNNVINFEYDLPEIIKIWEASLKKHPGTCLDPRHTHLALTLFEYSRDCSSHEAHELLKKAGEMSPDHDGIIRYLRATFETTGIPQLESHFWISRIDSTHSSFTELQPWYYVRLAQCHSGNQAYENVISCLKRIAVLGDYYLSEELLEAVRGLDVGDDIRKVWRMIVESHPSHFSVDELEAACKRTQSSLSSDIRMWRSLVLGNLSNSHLSLKLQSAFHASKQRDPLLEEEEIEFWKECIRLKPTDSNPCYQLQQSYKWRRGHDTTSDPVLIFDDEISTWKMLLVEAAPGSGMVWQYRSPQYLADAIDSKAKAISERNFPDLAKVWKESRDFWQFIRLHLRNAPPEFKNEVKKYIDDASALVKLLENNS